MHHPGLDDALIGAAMEAFYVLRSFDGLQKRPTTSELIDWVQALVISGVPAERVLSELPFLGVVLKTPQDVEIARRHLAIRGADLARRRGG